MRRPRPPPQQLLVRLVVPVDDEVARRLDPGRARERELTQRGHVCADALLAQQPQERDVREGLRPVDDASACADRAAANVRAARAQRLLAVDDERRPEALRELVTRHSPELEHAAVERAESGKSSSTARFCLLPFSAQ